MKRSLINAQHIKIELCDNPLLIVRLIHLKVKEVLEEILSGKISIGNKLKLFILT